MQCYSKEVKGALTVFLCNVLVTASSCVVQPRRIGLRPGQASVEPSMTHRAPFLVNINTASIDALEKLPGLGPNLAERIVEHRNKYGRFRRIEHLIAVRGISRRRFEELRPFITVE